MQQGEKDRLGERSLGVGHGQAIFGDVHEFADEVQRRFGALRGQDGEEDVLELRGRWERRFGRWGMRLHRHWGWHRSARAMGWRSAIELFGQMADLLLHAGDGGHHPLEHLIIGWRRLVLLAEAGQVNKPIVDIKTQTYCNRSDFISDDSRSARREVATFMAAVTVVPMVF